MVIKILEEEVCGGWEWDWFSREHTEVKCLIKIPVPSLYVSYRQTLKLWKPSQDCSLNTFEIKLCFVMVYSAWVVYSIRLLQVWKKLVKLNQLSPLKLQENKLGWNDFHFWGGDSCPQVTKETFNAHVCLLFFFF